MQGERYFWEALQQRREVYLALTGSQFRAIRLFLELAVGGRLFPRIINVAGQRCGRSVCFQALRILQDADLAWIEKKTNGRRQTTYRIFNKADSEYFHRSESKPPGKTSALRASAVHNRGQQLSTTVDSHSFTQNSSEYRSRGDAHRSNGHLPPPAPAWPTTDPVLTAAAEKALKHAKGWKTTSEQFCRYAIELDAVRPGHGLPELLELFNRTRRKQGIEDPRRRGGYLNALVKTRIAELREEMNVSAEKKIEQEQASRRRHEHDTAAAGDVDAQKKVAHGAILALEVKKRACERFRLRLVETAINARQKKFFAEADLKLLADSPRAQAEILGPGFLNINKEP